MLLMMSWKRKHNICTLHVLVELVVGHNMTDAHVPTRQRLLFLWGHGRIRTVPEPHNDRVAGKFFSLHPASLCQLTLTEALL